MARKKKQKKTEIPETETQAEEVQEVEVEPLEETITVDAAKGDIPFIDEEELLEQLEDVVEDVTEEVKKQRKKLGEFFAGFSFDWMSWLAPIIFVGLVIGAVYFLFGRGERRKDELLVGFPDRHGATDVYLYGAGQREGRGDLLVADVEMDLTDEAVVQIWADGQVVDTVQGAGFVRGEKDIPLYYRDGVDAIFGWKINRDVNLVEVMDDDNFYEVNLHLDSKDVTVQEYREGDMRCYVAEFGEKAERVGKADECFFSLDGKVLFWMEDDDEFTLTAMTLSNEKEVEVLVSDAVIDLYQASADGSHVMYVDPISDDQFAVHLVDAKKGGDKYVSEIYADIYVADFAPSEDYGYFIAENEDGLLELHVFESGKKDKVVAEGLYLGVSPGSEGAYLTYFVGDDFDETTIYAYKYSNGRSTEVYQGSDEIFIASGSFDGRVLIADIADDEGHFYTSKLDGSKLVKTLELKFDDYDVEGFYYMQGDDVVFWLLRDLAEDSLGLYVMPLDKEEAGYFLLAEWATLSVLTMDEKGEALVFAGAEDAEDEPDLFVIAVEEDAVVVLLDDDVISVAHAVFASDEKNLYYTKTTGSDLNDVSVYEVDVDGENVPKEVYEDALILDVSWGALNVFVTDWAFEEAHVGSGE